MARLNIQEALEEHKALYFERTHHLHVALPEEKHLLTFSGAIKYPFAGVNSEDWTDTDLHLSVFFPLVMPPQKAFQITQSTPFFTISGIDKGGDNHNGGWAIYDFALDGDVIGRGTGGLISFRTTVRVRGALFSLFRVGYTASVFGNFVQEPPLPPI